MSLPWAWQSQVEDWSEDFFDKYGRFPTPEELRAWMETLPDPDPEE